MVVAKLAGLPVEFNPIVIDEQDNEGIARGIASLDVTKAEAQNKDDEEFIRGEIATIEGGCDAMSKLLRDLLVPAYSRSAVGTLRMYESETRDAKEVEEVKAIVEIYRQLERESGLASKQRRSEELTETQVAEYKEVFELFDKEGGNTISTKDLGTVMRSLGESPTTAEIDEMIKEVDRNGSGKVHFSDFLELMAIQLS